MFKQLIKFIIASAMFTVIAFSAVSPITFAEDINISNNNGVTSNLRPITLPDVCIASNAGKCAIVNNAKGITSTQEIINIILRVAQFLTAVIVALAVLFIVYGGFKWMNPVDAKGADEGKKVLINSSIGLAIAILAGTIVTLVKGALSGSYF